MSSARTSRWLGLVRSFALMFECSPSSRCRVKSPRRRLLSKELRRLLPHVSPCRARGDFSRCFGEHRRGVNAIAHDRHVTRPAPERRCGHHWSAGRASGSSRVCGRPRRAARKLHLDARGESRHLRSGARSACPELGPHREFGSWALAVWVRARFLESSTWKPGPNARAVPVQPKFNFCAELRGCGSAWITSAGLRFASRSLAATGRECRRAPHVRPPGARPRGRDRR